MKPHDKAFEEIRQFVKAKFTELEAMEIPSEYFEETVDEIEHDLYTLGEEIDYWAENRKADRSRAKTLTFNPAALNRLFAVGDKISNVTINGERVEGFQNCCLDETSDEFCIGANRTTWPQRTFSGSFIVDCPTWTNADQERAIAAGCERRDTAPTRIELPPNPDLLNKLFNVSNVVVDEEAIAVSRSAIRTFMEREIQKSHDIVCECFFQGGVIVDESSDDFLCSEWNHRIKSFKEVTKNVDSDTE